MGIARLYSHGCCHDQDDITTHIYRSLTLTWIIAVAADLGHTVHSRLFPRVVVVVVQLECSTLPHLSSPVARADGRLGDTVDHFRSLVLNRCLIEWLLQAMTWPGHLYADQQGLLVGCVCVHLHQWSTCPRVFVENLDQSIRVRLLESPFIAQQYNI